MNYYIKNAKIVNEGNIFDGGVLISNGIISKIITENEYFDSIDATVIDAEGKYLIPGIIDEHVHFREPGMESKADIQTESRAAVAGGITSFMEMPNTVPQTVTRQLLIDKFNLASEKSLANFSFYIGATNDNLDEIEKIDPNKVCGVKLFMGSSTGNMLVDSDSSLEALFRNAPCLIAAHCEDESIIKTNTAIFKDLVSKGLSPADATIHPKIRTSEACFRSSAEAVELAVKTGAKLHIMHISTAKELSLFDNSIPLKDKRITAETCPHYLTFSEGDYSNYGFGIKCNPAIKGDSDRTALLEAIGNGKIDTIGTDHAPHLYDEKFTGDYFSSKSGFPSVENSLDLMIETKRKGYATLPKIVELMCHNPAILYQLSRRGFIREGYHADLALVDLGVERVITNDSVHYKCGWTPYAGTTVHSKVTHTFVNGNLVFENGLFHEDFRGEALTFSRA